MRLSNAQSLKSDWAFYLEGKQWFFNDELNATTRLFAKCGKANPEGFVLIYNAAVIKPGRQQFYVGNRVSFKFLGYTNAFVFTDENNLPAYNGKLADHGFECTYIGQIQLLATIPKRLHAKN